MRTSPDPYPYSSQTPARALPRLASDLMDVVAWNSVTQPWFIWGTATGALADFAARARSRYSAYIAIT